MNAGLEYACTTLSPWAAEVSLPGGWKLKEEGEEKAAAGLLFAGGSRFLQVQNFTLSAERPGRDQWAGRSGGPGGSRGHQTGPKGPGHGPGGRASVLSQSREGGQWGLPWAPCPPAPPTVPVGGVKGRDLAWPPQSEAWGWWGDRSHPCRLPAAGLGPFYPLRPELVPGAAGPQGCGRWTQLPGRTERLGVQVLEPPISCRRLGVLQPWGPAAVNTYPPLLPIRGSRSR